MKMIKKKIFLVAAGFGVLAPGLLGVLLENGIASGTLGYFQVNLDAGGETRDAHITATRASDGNLTTDEIVYDYFTYIDRGEGMSVIRLGSTVTSDPILNDDGYVGSAGSFTGSNENTINWEATSWMMPGEVTMQTRYEFRAETGTLGEIVLHQYLDEDVSNSVGDDFLVRRGSADARNLELFTLDGTERYGISHSGAYSTAQGLVNAEFMGWAADEYSDLRSAIGNRSVVVSKTGVINTSSLPPFIDEQFGQVHGPEDITSTLSWRVLSGATEAVIITSLGGVPEASSINLEDTFTVTYNRGSETMLETYWENVRLWDYDDGEWLVWEDRLREPGTPYEFTDLDPTSSYWLGSWNYSTGQWDISVVIAVYNLLQGQ